MTILRWARIQAAGLAEQSRVARELSRLSDRSLADINLSRSDIDAVAKAARANLVAQLTVGTPGRQQPAVAETRTLRHA